MKRLSETAGSRIVLQVVKYSAVHCSLFRFTSEQLAGTLLTWLTWHVQVQSPMATVNSCMHEYVQPPVHLPGQLYQEVLSAMFRL